MKLLISTSKGPEQLDLKIRGVLAALKTSIEEARTSFHASKDSKQRALLRVKLTALKDHYNKLFATLNGHKSYTVASEPQAINQ